MGIFVYMNVVAFLRISNSIQIYFVAQNRTRYRSINRRGIEQI